jgi:hypothetical protein
MKTPTAFHSSRRAAAIAAVAAFLILAPDAADAAGEVVGTVSAIQGAAVAMQEASPRTLTIGSDIREGDVVSTGVGGKVKMTMFDGSEFSLGERSLFIVEEFRLSAQQTNAFTNLIAGAVAVVTGRIAEADGHPFKVRTPVATLGVRGTTFWGGELDGDFQFALLDGPALIVENTGGTVELTAVGDGTLVAGPSVAPTAPVSWASDKIARAAAITTVP